MRPSKIVKKNFFMFFKQDLTFTYITKILSLRAQYIFKQKKISNFVKGPILKAIQNRLALKQKYL